MRGVDVEEGEGWRVGFEGGFRGGRVVEVEVFQAGFGVAEEGGGGVEGVEGLGFGEGAGREEEGRGRYGRLEGGLEEKRERR